MLTHANLVANVRQAAAVDGPRREDVLVNIFPFYHVAGLNAILNPSLNGGATVVLMTGRFDLAVNHLGQGSAARFGCAAPT
ncbi:MAG: hypothetical protein DMG38_06475 [Acidobacteria bacterium]|nr:MAG: hypothetical protein DMG38_06475 [Acidobacteriota bacterium]